MKPANNAPMYCAMYPSLAEICRSHGYALAVHGTMARDFDLIAIPWTDTPSAPQAVVDEITTKHAVNAVDNSPAMMRHNRLCYTLALYGEFFFDFSFMPVAIAAVSSTESVSQTVDAPQGLFDIQSDYVDDIELLQDMDPNELGRFTEWFQELERQNNGKYYDAPLAKTTGVKCWLDYFVSGVEPSEALQLDFLHGDQDS